jgi:hypothetical protein
LATLPRWRIGVVALAHVGIATLRLSIAAPARCERARDGALSFFFLCFYLFALLWVPCL